MRDAYEGPRRWPWVLLTLAIALLLLVFGGHWIWSSGAAKRLNAEVARIKGLGEPIEPEDFIISSVSDADNAALDLRAAARSIDDSTDAFKNFDALLLSPDFPLMEKEIAAGKALIAANAKAFELVDIAMTKKGVDWKIAVRSPAVNVLLPDLNEQRKLANLVRFRAMIAHQEGDDAAALADVRRVEFLANSLMAQPFLVSMLVSTGVRALASDSIEKMAPDLKIGKEAGAVSAEQVRAMIALLLDEQVHRKSARLGLYGERMVQLDSARGVANGTLSIAALTGAGRAAPPAMVALSLIARPVALDDGLLMIRHATATLEAMEKSATWPAYKNAAPPGLPLAVQRNRIRHFLAAILTPSYERAMQTHFRHMTDRRLVAIALAMRLYRLDHDGRWPAKLDDLVPKYLPTIPIDPMAADANLKFLPRADKPVVYSVGEDGKDDGGSETNTTKQKVYGRWQLQDAVMHLTRQPRDLADDVPTKSGVDAEALEPVPSTAPATTQSAQSADTVTNL